MWLSQSDIQAMDHRYKVNFINSLSGFKSANLIGSIDDSGQTNLAIVSSVFHLGANPALMGFINRPDSDGDQKVERHTLENIRQTKQFTINAVNQFIYQQAHQTSARYSKQQCEFEQTGLTICSGKLIKAPYVEQSSLRLGLEFKEEIKIELNGTHLIIGEIKEVFVQREMVAQDGYVDIEKLQTVAVSGLDSYHTSKRIARLKYAKVDQPTKKIF